jgi:hypothetical protein
LRCRESNPNPTLKFPVLRTALPNGYDTATMDWPAGVNGQPPVMLGCTCTAWSYGMPNRALANDFVRFLDDDGLTH